MNDALLMSQRQRVALARALIHAPGLMLLDEPLGALDALTRIEMQRLVESLWLEHRFTAVLVTHDVDEALALADRVLVLADGQIAHSANITVDRPRDRDHPDLVALRIRLLTELGVATRDVDELRDLTERLRGIVDGMVGQRD